jgi:cyclophilin family peptidyl-prolyl cis-trans isomerase
MFREMFSLDRITEGGDGYPLLFQTGETWEGKPLIDKQHPHDLFGELAIAYSHSLSGNSGFFLYLGYPGEPAFGPPVYLHRPSSQNNPDAPLGHHWQDATHISFGVATIGLQYEKFKLDGSIFTGREPDEKRLNFDKPRFDSYSFRVSMNPSEKTALQVSWSFLKSPEVLEPEVNVQRATASLIYYHPIGMEKGWATTFIWGMNKPSSGDAQNSLLVESELQLMDKSFYVRLEIVNKTSEDLGLTEFHERLFLVNALTLGASKMLLTRYGMALSLGVQGTAYSFEEELEPFYGSNPFSLEVFFRLSPGWLKMNNHKMNEM